MKDNRLSSYDWILIGLTFHSIGVLFADSNKTVAYTFCGVGLLIIFFKLIFSLKLGKPFSGIIKFLYYLFLLWSIYVVMYPFVNDETLTNNVYSPVYPQYILAYTIPLIVFFRADYYLLKSVFRFSFIYGIIGTIILLLNFSNIFINKINYSSEEYQTYIKLINQPSQFLLSTSLLSLCYPVISKKFRRVAFTSLLLYFIINLVAARRGNLFLMLLTFVGTFYIYAIGSKHKFKVFKITGLLTIVYIGANIFLSHGNSTFSLFFSRLNEDTRTRVEEYFFSSFKGRIGDWVFGRGINGTYYCPILDELYRGIIETGYLQLILKGGIIYLTFYVFFLLYSAYLGFYKSNNTLTKSMSFYLIIHAIALYPYGLPLFNLEYVILWICILYCQSKNWRIKTDLEIRLLLSNNYLRIAIIDDQNFAN